MTQNIYTQKEEVPMMLLSTRNFLSYLRNQSQTIRTNNRKISPWVDAYVNQCVLEGSYIELFTPWCIGKNLETRLLKQGGSFTLLSSEIKTFETMERIISYGVSQGLLMNWTLTFNNAFFDSARIPESIGGAYISLIKNFIDSNKVLRENVIVLNWEIDVRTQRPSPDPENIRCFKSFISEKAYAIDLKNFIERTKKYKNFSMTQEEIKRDVIYNIVCEAEEGVYLMKNNPLFSNGNFIFIPLEFTERIVNFTCSLAPLLKERIVPVLRPYPWRMDSDTLEYMV